MVVRRTQLGSCCITLTLISYFNTIRFRIGNDTGSSHVELASERQSEDHCMRFNGIGLHVRMDLNVCFKSSD